MSGEVIDIRSRLSVVGDDSVFPVSLVAENAAATCTHLVCIGYDKDGKVLVYASHGVAESFLLTSLGAQHLLDATGRMVE